VPFADTVIVDSESVPTAVVVTVNVASDWPAATVTVVGTAVAVPVLLTETTKPPTGAGPVIVTVPVLDVPPITDDGVKVIPSTVDRFTVNVAVFVTPFAAALTVAVTFAETDNVVAVAPALTAPSGTVIDAGTPTAALFEDSATAKPPAGAGPAKVTVTSADVPPITEFGLTTTDSTALRRTVTCADFDVPFADAAMETTLSATTAAVVTLNVADVALRGTVIVAGTTAEVESDANATVKPPSGAGPVSVTVPVALLPPTTLDGAIATAETPLRVIVNDPDLLKPFAEAVTETDVSACTAVVVTANVALV